MTVLLLFGKHLKTNYDNIFHISIITMKNKNIIIIHKYMVKRKMEMENMHTNPYLKLGIPACFFLIGGGGGAAAA